jgi:hypothetical protein
LKIVPAACAASLAALAVFAACDSPKDTEVVQTTTDGGLSGFGEDGFQCPAPITSRSCCGLDDCALAWNVASSCAAIGSPPAGTTYLLDSTPCGGQLERQTSVTKIVQGAEVTTTTFALFDATTGALLAMLSGPGTGTSGFECSQGPVALVVSNQCLVHWQSATVSDACIDAGAAGAPEDAGCAAAEGGPDAGPDTGSDAAAFDASPE